MVAAHSAITHATARTPAEQYPPITYTRAGFRSLCSEIDVLIKAARELDRLGKRASADEVRDLIDRRAATRSAMHRDYDRQLEEAGRGSS